MMVEQHVIKPQEWTLEDIRYRLTEAADTLRLMPMPKGGFPAGYRTGWPDVVYEWTAYGYTPATARRSPPTADKIDKLDQTLAWLHWLERDQRMIVWARACGFSWRKIEDIDGRSTPTLRKICSKGYSDIYQKLNQDRLTAAARLFMPRIIK
jgi:hypothetical protein